MIWREKRIKDVVLEDSQRSSIYHANVGLKPGSIPSKGRDTWHIVPLVAP